MATLLIDVLGRRRLQLCGFLGMSVSYCLCGALMSHLLGHRSLFYSLYGLTFFFCQGPNVSAYVLPSELFPTTIRSTAHGISSACGKIGALIASIVVPELLNRAGLAGVMYLSASVSALATLVCAALTHETMDQPLPHTKHEPHVPHSLHAHLAVAHSVHVAAAPPTQPAFDIDESVSSCSSVTTNGSQQSAVWHSTTLSRPQHPLDTAIINNLHV